MEAGMESRRQRKRKFSATPSADPGRKKHLERADRYVDMWNAAETQRLSDERNRRDRGGMLVDRRIAKR